MVCPQMVFRDGIELGVSKLLVWDGMSGVHDILWIKVEVVRPRNLIPCFGYFVIGEARLTAFSR